jgi:adenylosuccinate synthase
MPVSVIVGGQYGSEGKGKVALYVARQLRAQVVVRVGGPNSGHTAVDHAGRTWVFRQLPASCLAPNTIIVLPAGSLIDPDILLSEVKTLQIQQEHLIIDGNATVVLARHREEEAREALIERIGSTGSGTGAALRDRIARGRNHVLAREFPPLREFVRPFAAGLLREFLQQQQRVIIEGTQGFGLSIWHGSSYPHATSRDTTASAFLSETGLAPTDVDDVVLVVRSFPIRVGGNSGPLENETSWSVVAAEANLPSTYVELTSATKRVRRVGRFHPEIVMQAIAANAPHRIVMNHLDYVDPGAATNGVGPRGRRFLKQVEEQIGRHVDLIGLSPTHLMEWNRDSEFSKMPHASFS